MSSVLVVDDDRDTRDLIGLLLEDAGYQVVTAGNGKEALTALEDGLRPDAIVLDLMMPVMNGWEFREKVLRDTDFAAIPTVVVTGDTKAAQRAAKLGAAGYLSKPFEATALLELLAHVTDPGANGEGAKPVSVKAVVE